VRLGGEGRNAYLGPAKYSWRSGEGGCQYEELLGVVALLEEFDDRAGLSLVLP
jgi:hypothetical protein